jgi:uncharacterized protein
MADRLTPILSNVVDVTDSSETLQVSEIGAQKSDFSSLSKPKFDGMRVWIDIDNSPHVPFFLPIIRELEKYGVELVLTARDMYQVSELVEFFRLRCDVVGGHYGKNKVIKVLGSLLRAAQLFPTASKLPTLALSAGSRAQILVCKALGIPTMMMHDYEHSIKTGFIEPDWILMPDVIPERAMSRNPERVLKYPGIKEDVYVLGFRPDPSFLDRLNITRDDLVVTLRPPATEAHYHNPESEKLFDAAVRLLYEKPMVRAVTLPRNAKQKKQLQEQWAGLVASGRMIIPDEPLNGLDLIWFSDLVISAGGTMNREAAALGVPVYSVFRGKIGALDQYLADNGRLTLIESAEELNKKIMLVRWNRPAIPQHGDRPALRWIVNFILKTLEGLCLPPGQLVR